MQQTLRASQKYEKTHPSMHACAQQGSGKRIRVLADCFAQHQMTTAEKSRSPALVVQREDGRRHNGFDPVGIRKNAGSIFWAGTNSTPPLTHERHHSDHHRDPRRNGQEDHRRTRWHRREVRHATKYPLASQNGTQYPTYTRATQNTPHTRSLTRQPPLQNAGR